MIAGLDAGAVVGIVGYWTGGLDHSIAIVATALGGLWYAYCIFEALEKRFRKD